MALALNGKDIMNSFSKGADSKSSVWESVTSNAYATIESAQNEAEKIEHTRIYRMFDTEIQLDEMSMPLSDIPAESTIDTSSIDVPTGAISVSEAKGIINDYKTLENEANESNLNGKDYTTEGSLLHDRTLAIGKAYPLIRINDRYLDANSIENFALSSTGFIPTISLMISTADNDLLKNNLIKDGDICSVFINQGHGLLKSYRGDFIITNSYVLNKKQSNRNTRTRIYVEGELNIPKMYDSTLTFSVVGTSKEALVSAAQQLGLGFNFCDEDNTKDTQVWYCTSDGDQSVNSQDSPAIKFLKNTARHAYKDFYNFYDCWIDIRYGLSFINIAKMLGISGLDERIDLAFFNSMMSNNMGNDGQKGNPSDDETKSSPKLQPKLLSNVFRDEKAMTAFMITDIEEINNGGSITKQLGMSYNSNYNIRNAGLSNGSTDIQMSFSIPTNADKLNNGFYTLSGPGTNSTYKQADNGSYVEQHSSTQGGTIADTQSDSDARLLEETGSNMKSSGNTNKYYEAGEKHNLLNNKWLQKKMIKMKINGCNLQMMRGEKIPTLVLDNPGGVNLFGVNADNIISKKIIENYSGWFIIKSIKWIYDGTKVTNMGTQWTTEVMLTRREWPIIGYNKQDLAAEIIIVNSIDTGTVLESKTALSDALSSTEDQTGTGEDGFTGEQTTTDGLNEYMVRIYNDIKTAVEASNGSILLTSARRWAVDEDGNKIQGGPVVSENGLYKFINATGKVCWFSDSASPHVTGDAIDIINNTGTKFNDIIKIVAKDFATLADMLDNDVYCAIETGKDEMGQSVKHLHVGKVSKEDQTLSSQYTAWWEIVKEQLESSTFSYNGKTYDIDAIISGALNSESIAPVNTSQNDQNSSNISPAGISYAMLNKICQYETGKSYGYAIAAKELNGYDLGDANGHLTYGYGLLYHPNGKYMDSIKKIWTQAELEDLYMQTVKSITNKVSNWAKSKKVQLNTNQLDAIVCASYNFGWGGFSKKSVCDLISVNPKNPNIKSIWEHLSDQQGRKYPGLITRRKMEASWYFGSHA